MCKFVDKIIFIVLPAAFAKPREEKHGRDWRLETWETRKKISLKPQASLFV